LFTTVGWLTSTRVLRPNSPPISLPHVDESDLREISASPPTPSRIPTISAAIHSRRPRAGGGIEGGNIEEEEEEKFMFTRAALPRR
jgi:hypothetical protein